MFTNPPSYMPTAGPDLSADFSQSMLSEITSQLESFGTIKSGECDHLPVIYSWVEEFTVPSNELHTSV